MVWSLHEPKPLLICIKIGRQKTKKIDEDSARAVELMKKKLDELPGGVEQNNGQIAWKGDIYDQVISKPERYGQVRGVGLGICPSKLWGGQSSSIQSSHTMLNDDASKEEIEKIFEERMKVIQENHQKELRAVQQKSDMEFKKLLDRQSRLEGHISRLISFVAERAESEGYASDDDDLCHGWESYD